MIAVSEIAIAVVSSIVIVVIGVLLLSVVARFVRSVGWRIRACRSGREFVPDPGTSSASDNEQDEEAEPPLPLSLAMAGFLAASVVLTLVGAFVPLYRDFGRAGHSVRLYNTMQYRAIVFYVDCALLATLSIPAAKRPSRTVTAVIVGYCAPALGGSAVFVAGFTFASTAHLGPGYYLFGLGQFAQAAALVIAALILLTPSVHRPRPSARSVRLAVIAAVLIAGTSTMRSDRFVGEPLWIFAGWPWQGVTALVGGLVAVALVPLVAVRVTDRTARFMVLGLMTTLVVNNAASAALDTLWVPRFQELTVGFWGTIAAVVALALLRSSLRSRRRPLEQHMAVPVT